MTYFLTFHIYYNFLVLELVIGPTDNTYETIGTLKRCSQTSICFRTTWQVCRSSLLSPIPTFLFSTWEVGSEKLYYILCDCEGGGP